MAYILLESLKNDLYLSLRYTTFLSTTIIIFSLQCEHPRHEYCAQRNIKCVTEGCIDFLCLPVFPFFGSPRNIIVIIILPLWLCHLLIRINSLIYQIIVCHKKIFLRIHFNVDLKFHWFYCSVCALKRTESRKVFFPR